MKLKHESRKTAQGHLNPTIFSKPQEKLKEYSEEYDFIFKIANNECPPPPEVVEKKRGREAKGKEKTLIERLIKLKNSVCLFIKDFAVPFDNNQAERDLRNVKTKSKVSGCFQSKEGTQVYLTVISFLSTASKHGADAYEALN